ncbi:MAG: rhomboid family intramembrane serine protease [Flammeovirgaceae bacterium]
MNSFNALPNTTKVLLIINIAFFAVAALYPQLTDLLALHHFESSLFKPHQLLTHIFMHGGLAHLFFNMYALFMFGAILESQLGALRFNLLYFFSAIGAFVLHMGINWFQLQALPVETLNLLHTEGAEILAKGMNYKDEVLGNANIQYNGAIVGASGALMGILAGFAMLFPNAKLSIIFIPFQLEAKYFMPIYMVIELVLGVSSFQWDNIAHFAHLGGAIFGFILMLIWIKSGKIRKTVRFR